MKPILVIAAGIMLLAAAALGQSDDQTVYVTKSGTKYHSAGCSYLSKSSIGIKRSELSSKYTPCSRCSPGATEKSTSTEKNSVGETDRTIHTGPRGGQYYINKNGKKVYLRKKK